MNHAMNSDFDVKRRQFYCALNEQLSRQFIHGATAFVAPASAAFSRPWWEERQKMERQGKRRADFATHFQWPIQLNGIVATNFSITGISLTNSLNSNSFRRHKFKLLVDHFQLEHRLRLVHAEDKWKNEEKHKRKNMINWIVYWIVRFLLASFMARSAAATN